MSVEFKFKNGSYIKVIESKEAKRPTRIAYIPKPITDFKTQYLGEWVRQVDCNDCTYLNLTEEQQEYQGKGIHRCLYYDERVFHRTNNLIHNRMIYPCDKCYEDKHESFIKRQ